MELCVLLFFPVPDRSAEWPGSRLISPEKANTANALSGPNFAFSTANTPDNLQHWIMNPHQIEQHTAMPEMGVSDEDSKDIAAYLYTLH